MAKIQLKNIIGKKIDATSLIPSVITALETSVCIRDDNGKVLYGDENIEGEQVHDIKANGEIIGTITGNKQVEIIANLLNYLSQKEAEKKRLGGEILHLYQEINLIFNFSEKLAQTIDAPSICTATLNEAKHVITSDYGVIILWDETKKLLQVISSYGAPFFSQDVINANFSHLMQIILSGQSEIVTDTTTLIEKEIISPQTNSVIYSALKVNQRIMGAIILGTEQQVQYTAADLKLLTTLALQSSAAVESALLYDKNLREAKEREDAMRQVYEVTGKFVPYEFIQSLGHKVLTDVKLGDQVEKIVTVLFSDIRNYTTLSEQMTPGENFKFVCSFNERMGPIIRSNNGFINQFLGDAIMAIFPGNSSEALTAAIDMQKEVKALNKQRKLNGQTEIQIGIGMHAGPLIMGITGDQERMDATTISDTVNTASRLESLTKYYKTSIILSDSCLKQIGEKDFFYLRYLGIVQLKGKQEPVHIHECFNGLTDEEVSKKQKTLPLFQKAIDNYLNKLFTKAVTGFETIIEMDPEDHTVNFFLEKAKKNLQKGVPEDWNGILEMTTK